MSSTDPPSDSSSSSIITPSRTRPPIEDPSSPYYIHPADGPGISLVSEKLNDTNYQTWNRAMFMALSVKNKSGFVDGSLTKPIGDPILANYWDRNNLLVMTWLNNSLSKEIHHTVQYHNSALDLWNELKQRFHQASGPRLFQLRRDLLNLQQQNLSVNTYYSQLKILWDEICNFRPKCDCGVCPTVGVGGHFSGGGYSMMSRKHGLAVDNIIDAIVINANGEILDRDSMGDDLFWAIRGGGGTSFGIVVAFKVKLVTVPETVIVFNVARTLEQNATQLVHKWQYISDKIDENLSIRVFLGSVIKGSSSKENQRIQASFTSLFIGGGVGDLLQIMEEKFPELGLVEEDCIEMTWIESVLFFGRFPNGSPIDALLNRTGYGYKYFKGKSDYMREPIPKHGLEGIWKYLNEEDQNGFELQFSPWGGKLSTISESETPFPHRSGNIFMIHYVVDWSTDSQRHLNWTRSLYSYMAPFVSKSPRTAYLNYRDLDIGRNNDEGNITSYKQASVWGFKYFKNNFNRLVRVKTNVDSSNFFRNEQSIPPLPYYITKKNGIINNESFIV
ncbi:hypothetical protein RD792_006289 [Penstemon davidsonii]|uniref:FAD-binding PCMH-type domain-containing protein n=1 Tax=Penstemon davidsonii TaxID=160366 RepID=A0ABR0DD60_9LAMI|nr:hypothetical protein RD792_006289 [Penstemon davidsonii]